MRQQLTTRAAWLCSAVAAATLATACANASERAPGAPLTDITRTSTETYAHAKPYVVSAVRRDGGRVVATINVSNVGNAEAIAREAAADLKGDAQEVDLTVYDAETRPPEPAWARASLSGGSFRFERLPDREQADALKH